MPDSFTEMLTKSLPSSAGLSFERVGIFSVTRISLSKSFTPRQDSLLIPTSLQCMLFSSSFLALSFKHVYEKILVEKSHLSLASTIFLLFCPKTMTKPLSIIEKASKMYKYSKKNRHLFKHITKLNCNLQQLHTQHQPQLII